MPDAGSAIRDERSGISDSWRTEPAANDSDELDQIVQAKLDDIADDRHVHIVVPVDEHVANMSRHSGDSEVGSRK